MKKVWVGLSVACLGIGIVSGLTDVIKGDVTKDTGVFWISGMALEN